MFYEAIYAPQETAKLSDKALKFVGKQVAIQDGGQEELTPGHATVVYIASPSFGLIPNHDLKSITSIPLSRWTELSERNKKNL